MFVLYRLAYSLLARYDRIDMGTSFARHHRREPCDPD